MINYILNKNTLNFKYYKSKKNSFTNIHPPRKLNININHSSKNTNEKNVLNIISPNNKKNEINLEKNIVNEFLIKREISTEETKIKIKNNKTNTNSPIRKLIFSRYPSLKKLSQKNKESIYLPLNNYKDNNYKMNIKNNITNHNISLYNNTNITNNNITTNFTNSVNNTVGSITNNNNNNSNNFSYKKNVKIIKKQKKDVKIKITVLYKDRYYNIELNQFNNGLWLAKKINSYFNICLSESLIHNLAIELTRQINNIINCIINRSNIMDYGAVIDINKLIEENEKNNNFKRYKVIVRYNHEDYYFFVNNNNEDINAMTYIIINNIIKNEKYDSSSLRDEIIKKIKFSFDKANNKNQIITDI